MPAEALFLFWDFRKEVLILVGICYLMILNATNIQHNSYHINLRGCSLAYWRRAFHVFI